MNIAQIEESLRELVGTPFDPAVFIYRLLEIYGAPKATVTKLRQANSDSDSNSCEVVVKKKLVFRVAPKGKTSAAAAAADWRVRVVFNGKDITAVVPACAAEAVQRGNKSTRRSNLCSLSALVSQVEGLLGGAKSLQDACRMGP